ncbi:MAG: hypothetical protein NTW87_27325 [Planctomycetota bacterium]|nr:hypothetical protein [Planctomycetota bacterium]
MAQPAIRRDWGTLFYDSNSARVRLWYCRGRIHTTNELAEANVHPLRAWYLGDFSPQDYDADRVAEAVAALVADEYKRGVDVVEPERVTENLRWIRRAGNAARFKLTPEQREALLSGRVVEFGDLFGVLRARAADRKPGS